MGARRRRAGRGTALLAAGLVACGAASPARSQELVPSGDAPVLALPEPNAITLRTPPRYDRAPLVRVWLADVSGEIVIACAGACRIRPGVATVPARIVLTLPPSPASVQDNGIRLGGVVYPADAVDLEPQSGVALTLNGKVYPGALRLVRNGPRLEIITAVDLETYVMRVVMGEMPASWPDEALKAQAVAARTYALHACLDRADKAWDVMSTVEDQVYRAAHPNFRVRRAVQETEGRVLLHEGRVFPAFYHSTCGGRTETPLRALGRPGCEFLEPVSCTDCGDSRHATWAARLDPAQLAERLRKGGVAVDGLPESLAVAPSEQGELRVRIAWPGGAADVSAVEFRRLVGRMEVKSPRFECRLEGGALVLSGRGLGHGAGMCQYGARGMAARRVKAEDILAHYYRNCDLVKLY